MVGNTEEETVLEETHDSWVMVSYSRISSTPGIHLFDSEIPHQHYIRVRVQRCTRRRDLSRDWLHATQTLIEFDMSEAQFGAFISSANTTGVPATLTWLDGPIEEHPFESRLDESHKEVKEAGDRALKRITLASAAVEEAFERGAGKKEMRELIRDLHSAVANAPANMEFAAKSLTEHVENVVTKARADLEGMLTAAQDNPLLIQSAPNVAPLLESGDDA